MFNEHTFKIIIQAWRFCVIEKDLTSKSGTYPQMFIQQDEGLT